MALVMPGQLHNESVVDSVTQAQPHNRHWTRDDYYKAADLGIFRPDEKLELIEGEVLVKVSPMGTKHAVSIYKATRELENITENQFIVRAQMPFVISEHTEPEPDICVAIFREDGYLEKHPEPSDIKLIIEVSDTTLQYDCVRKVVLYANANIPEYWIINLIDNRLEVRRNPETGFGYRSIATYNHNDLISPLFLPDTELLVSKLLPLPINNISM